MRRSSALVLIVFFWATPAHGQLDLSWHTIDCGGGRSANGCGDCTTPSGTGGCSDPVCTALMCVQDPFCCDVQWDGICADAATTVCDCAVTWVIDGTLGQPDPGVAAGGDWTLVGGFWAGDFAAPPCIGDTNDSGVVDVDDLVAVILDWATDGSPNGGDVNGTGLVDVDDLVLVILNFGPCPTA